MTTETTSESSPKSAKHAPVVKSWPILGPALDLLRDPCGYMVSCYHRYGPIYRLRTVGQEITVLAGFDANTFFAKQGDRVFRTKDIFEKMSGQLGTDNHISALDGAPHRHMRKVLKPGFSREAIAHAVPAMLDIVERAAAGFVPGQSLPVLETMQKIVVEEGALSLANSSVGPHFRDIQSFSKTLIAAGVAFRPRILFYDPRYRAAKARFERFSAEVLAEHRAHPPDGQRAPDLLDTALAARDAGGCPLGDRELHSCTHFPFVNTVMYPSRACGFLLYALLRHPEMLARVVAEVDEVLAAGPLSLERLKQMRLLRAAMLESARMYPIALSLPRHVIEPFEFGGCRVEAGSTVLVATAVTHFLPEFFPDPRRFDPERCLAPRNEHMQARAYVPFGLGAHACISAGVVETLVMITMAGLLHRLRFEIDPPEYQLEHRADPVPGPVLDFRVRVVGPRERIEPAATPVASAEEELADVLPDLEASHLAAAAGKLERRSYAAGTAIVEEGQPADRFFVISAGEVEVLKSGDGGTSRVVARLGAGEYFGEIGILGGGRRTATVRAAGAVQTLELVAEAFRELVAESDLTSTEIARLIRRRTTATHLALALPNLDAGQIASVSEGAEVSRHAAGAVIIRQGDPADRFFIVAKGRAEVVNHHPSGHDIVLGSLGPGEYFGEVGLLTGRPRSATVRAATEGPVEVVSISGEAFRKMLSQSEATSSALALVMCERLADLGRRSPGPSTPA